MHILYSAEYPSNNTTEDCHINKGYIRATPSGKTLSYRISENFTLSISATAPSTQQSSVYTSWYFNGYSSLPSGTSLSSLLKLPTGFTQTLRINNLTHLHAGTYEALLLLNYRSYRQHFGCPKNYVYFVDYNSRAGVNPIILDQISIDLQYYGELILMVIPLSGIMFTILLATVTYYRCNVSTYQI